MDDRPAALVEDLLEIEMQPTQHGDPSPLDKQGRPNRTRGLRFTHPSGSRPLDGYTIKRGIGIGGFGEVYFALNDAGKEVALKRIQRNLDIELRGVRQCLNLKHVNLIKLWDIRTNEHDESWVVMEYVPGDSLRDVVELHPQGMPDDKLRLWFDSISAGVTYLHDRGIVHRDLKPGNIFRDEDEQVIKIGDYGLSKFISCSNRDGQTESVGTFHYMAPEIGKGVYGKEIDIYALGIILFEMLTGRVPYEGESSQEIIMKHLTADPDLMGIREPYRSVIQKALTKDPEQRFRDVPEMMEAINGGGVVHAPDESSQAASPELKPMFIGVELATDAEIRFGELRNSNVPTNSQAGIESSLDSTIEASTANMLASSKKTPLVIGPDGLPEEPIARAVTGGWQQATDWWAKANLSTSVKVIILAGIGFLLLLNSPWLIPTSIGLGLLYLLYYTIRSLIQPNKTDKAPKVSRTEKVEYWRGLLAARPVADRFTEALGSLVASGLVCSVLGFFTLLATADQGGTQTQHWAFYAWSVTVAMVASWSLLISSKMWEHRKGEATLRRFVMMSVGVGVGVFAFAASAFLNLNWSSQGWIGEPDLSPFSPSAFTVDGGPRLIGSALFFGGLFLILRWWRLADPTRRTRLSIWSVGLCLVWGMLIGQFFYFPQPWSCLLAVMIAVATQIGSPWLTSEQRDQALRLARVR